ncbi:MAG: Exodeoxyribonuclease 7 large subunit [Parcubacteria group bacterium ADurb.Bin247]|jgi:exodeoxyribonuclease VII large subunit|nr:MAG: Exodeoxyribonuclease 7 large subunit [Parcubacteria group bacterium ADurb.Bin247]HQB18662.1 exodeoxyribonuclease VII large subunit [Candidatus Pacearchaeota archaeon]
MNNRFEEPISVSEYIQFLNELLGRIQVKLIGEVVQLKIHQPSGHVYFTLKDKEGAVINCVIWKYNYRMCGVSLTEGMTVIISGGADIYPVRGTLTFKANTVELVGAGALKKAYDELKAKLQKEGLFDNKRPIPDYPQKIGVITSLYGGTVIHDFTSNLGKFGFKIKAINAKVEGVEAVKELLSAINQFKKEDIDVLVVIRGGGSLESLIAFDNEILVREIANFPVPVIAGIGHHKDVTLVSLAADATESTPSAAAYFLNKSWENAIHKVNSYNSEIINSFTYALQKTNKRIELSLDFIIRNFNNIFEEYTRIEVKIKGLLMKIQSQIINNQNNLESLKIKILRDFIENLDHQKRIIINFDQIIHYNNPEKQLKMGYSISRINGKIIKDINQVKVDDNIDIQILNGIIKSKIKKIKK